MATITGNNGDNLLTGTDGDDVIKGKGGNDTIFAGDGNDTVDGGAGDDTIEGGEGDNVLRGGAGDDIITAGAGNDDINGGGGNDTIDAGDGDNKISGGGGADHITAGSGNDDITGGADDDIIDAGDGNNIIRGGGGSDVITAGSGDDDINGGQGNDIINAGDGNNVIRGGGGNDVITSGAGNDDIRGGADDDIINAGDGDNIIRGGGGSDLITTGSGDDDITGGQGNDIINAGDGNNVIRGGGGNDVITSGSGNDDIRGGADDDNIDAGDGDNIVDGRQGDDVITTGSGNDTISGGAGNDTISAGDGNNTIDGDAGDDTIMSGAGNDVILGGAGNDTIDSGGGSDVVDAGQGDDVASYVVAQNVGSHDIYNGNKGSDTLRLVLAPSEAANAVVQADIAAFQAFLEANANANKNNGAVFQFTAFDLTVSNFEALEVVIDGGGDNQAPVAIDDIVSTDEDTSISFNVVANDVDPDAGQTLTAVDVSALSDPSLGTLVDLGNGQFEFIAAANASGTATFTYRTFDGQETSAQVATVTIDVAPMADAPSITANPISFEASSDDVPLGISIALTDLDEVLGATVSIDGVPSSFQLNYGFAVEDGTWIVPASDVPDLALQPVGGIPTPGVFVLHVTATSIDGASTASTTADIGVTITPGAQQQSGHVIDGYIAGATVFADANENGVLDDGEARTTTNADGSFTLSGGSGSLVMFGGTDVSTGLAFGDILKAPAGSTVVTPLTTLVATLAALPGGNVADAKLAVAAAFGIDPGIDLQTFDPVPGAVGGDPAASAVLSAAIQVQSTISQVSAVGGSSSSVVTAIANAITTASGGTVNLSDSSTVTSIATSSGVSATAAAAVTQVVTAANQSIQSATNVTELAQAAVVAQGAATAALAATDFDDPTQVDTLTQDYVADLGTQVANATAGAVGVPIVGTLGNDVLNGTSGNDVIDGRDGSDKIDGGDGEDRLYGGAGKDALTGGAGNDLIDGGADIDLAIYTDAIGPVTVDLAAGTATGAGIGDDTLRSIERIRGSNFDDSYVATGFNSSSANASSPPQGTSDTFNEFEGMDGDDTIVGNGNTRASYLNASAGVRVDLTGGTAYGFVIDPGTMMSTIDLTDAAGVGVDTIVSGVTSVRGSAFNDILRGAASNDAFEGLAGNDIIVGLGGFDLARYEFLPSGGSFGAVGITVNMAAGTVTGLDAVAVALVGTDTLRAIEAVRGTNSADTYVATNFGAAGFVDPSVNNVGSNGTLNQFEGMGGNDTITGNGNTRVSYQNAAAGVTVTMTGFGNGFADGTAAGDIAGVGHDTFSGVFNIRGSQFNDVLNGAGSNDTLDGQAGNDTINGNNGNDILIGGAGDDALNGGGGTDIAIFSGPQSAYTFGVGTVSGPDGSDTTFSTELYQFGDSYRLGTGLAPIDLSSFGLIGGFSIFGRIADDLLTIGQNANGRLIDLGAGDDTLTLGTPNGNYFLNLANVEHLVGSNGNEDVTFAQAPLANMTIDLSFGEDTLHLTDSDDVATVMNVEFVYGYGGTDSITFQHDDGSFNQSFDLGFGEGDMLFLTGANSDFALSIYGDMTVVGATDGGDETVTVANGQFGSTFDLGAGYDTLYLSDDGDQVTVKNVEAVHGFGGFDSVTFVHDDASVGQIFELGFGGGDSLTLAGANSDFTLSLGGDMTIIGATDGGDETVTLLNGQFGNTFELGAGNDTINLADGGNDLTVVNVETVHGGIGNDTVTFVHDEFSSGELFDLGNGEGDTLILAGANSDFELSLYGDMTVLDMSYGGNTTVRLLNTQSGTTFDVYGTIYLADGGNDVTVIRPETVYGGIGTDTVTFEHNEGSFGESFDLGTGENDTLILSGSVSNFGLALYGDMTVIDQSFGGETVVGVSNTQAGTTFDLGFGSLYLSEGDDVVTVKSAGFVFGSDGADTVTFQHDDITVNQSFDLGFGADDTLILAGSNSEYNLYIGGGTTVVGASDSGDETVTLLNAQGGSTFDLGDGNDTLNLANDGMSGNGVSVQNVEYVNAIGFDSEHIHILGNSAGSTTVTTSGGADMIWASADEDHIRYTSVTDSVGADQDSIVGFDASQDQFVFDGMSGDILSNISFIDAANFNAVSGVAEARLEVFDPNNAVIQIDGNGDGLEDMTIALQDWVGTLQDTNFIVV